MARIRRPSPRSQDQIDAHRVIREIFARERPSLEQLVSSGDAVEVLKQGDIRRLISRIQ